MSSSSVQIIVENGGILTILKDGKMDTIPNTVYNKMKIGDFENERIFYHFEDGKEVEETYDDGIFNCTIDNEPILQLRDGEIVARAIREHQEHGRLSILKKAYLDKKEESYSSKAIEEFLEPFTESGRVKKIEKGYLVDKRFIVTPQAQALRFISKKWINLCIVVQNDINPFDIDTPFGKTEISANTVEVLSKVLFLLKPNTGDRTFMNQLAPEIQEQLKRDFPPPPPECKRISEFQRDEDGFQVQCTGFMETHDALTGLLVCNTCKRSSIEDAKKWNEERIAQNKLSGDDTMLDEYLKDNELEVNDATVSNN